MTPTKSLSERLRVAELTGPDRHLLTEAADALDQKDDEIELMKEGRKLHDELADHLEHGIDAKDALLTGAASEMGRLIVLLAKAEEALENAACAGVKGAAEALAAIRAKETP